MSDMGNFAVAPAAETQMADHNRPKAGADTAPGNVDKIREILFGNHMREYDARFAKLEETLLKEAAELRDGTRRRFEALEAFVKSELDSLQARLKSEREERTSQIKQHGKELQEVSEGLSARLRDLDDTTSEAQRKLRNEILDQSRSLMDEMRSRQEEIGKLLDRRFQELRASKTDRAALAALFSEVALRLNKEFHIPGADH